MMLCELYDKLGKMMREHPEAQTQHVILETCCDFVDVTAVVFQKEYAHREGFVMLEGRG